MSSTYPSSVPSATTDNSSHRRRSVESTETDYTSTTEFLAAVATEPPRNEDFEHYPNIDATSPNHSNHFLDQCDQLPSVKSLNEAANIPVLDVDNNELAFKHLYNNHQHHGQRHLILFIRHWYCRACQDYIRCLQDLIPPASYDKVTLSQIPTRIVLIGCGHPSLIKSYAKRTECPYTIYTEPTLRLQRLLGCHRWGGILWGFGRRPAYVGDTSAIETGFKSMMDKYKSIYTDSLSGESSSEMGSNTSQAVKNRRLSEYRLKKRPSVEGLRSGPIFQVGGEFLFENGELVWCHRMKGMRSHAEIKVLRRALHIDGGDERIEHRLEAKWLEQELNDHISQGRQSPKQLRRKVEQPSTYRDSSRAQRNIPLISDEEEDRCLAHELGRNLSVATFNGKLQLVSDPNSSKAHLSRNEVGRHRNKVYEQRGAAYEVETPERVREYPFDDL